MSAFFWACALAGALAQFVISKALNLGYTDAMFVTVLCGVIVGLIGRRECQ